MYEVRWKRTALDRVTELWLDAPDRTAITAAVDELDRLLARDPQEAGESRSESVRIVFVPPLGVFYEIDEATQIVHVLRVWSF